MANTKTMLVEAMNQALVTYRAQLAKSDSWDFGGDLLGYAETVMIKGGTFEAYRAAGGRFDGSFDTDRLEALGATIAIDLVATRRAGRVVEAV